MDLAERISGLLEAQAFFVAARVYSGYKLMGTPLIATPDEVFGDVEGQALQDEMVRLARQALAEKKSQTRIVGEGLKVFFEVFTPPETVLIAGAGHVALPLCQMAGIADFRVVVLDDREEYANADRFPEADEILVGPFAETLQRFPFTAHTYVVLVTRGHTYDQDCLKAIFDRPVAYIGMIGSRRRLSAVFELMEQQGYSRERLRAIHAPIGLPIGGKTPEAIAVSILAEIVSVRYRGPQWALGLKEDFAAL